MSVALSRNFGRPTFGDLLCRHRSAAGLTQDELAERSGVSVVTISALERGVRRAPYRNTVALLASALELGGAARGELEAAAVRGAARGARAAPAHEVLRDNLPWQATPFIGRSAEIAELEELLHTQRLVTVTGAGGIGKTRTALKVAGRLARGGRRVVFVDLAPLSEGSFVLGRIAAAAGVHLSGREETGTELLNALRALDLLLLFDNCEHVIDDVGGATNAILQGCAKVTILATSRERLRLAGEAVYCLLPLPLPSKDQVSAGSSQGSAAIELFVRRAAAADSHFDFSESNVAAVADICRRLDGIPLAIELAAARLSALGLASLRTRLEEQLGLLSLGSRDAPARQRAMAATIAWSYDLLAEHDQMMFRRLSVFVGGWTVEAAEAVCSDDFSTKVSVVDSLSSLVDKSLVAVTRAKDAARYHMLAVTRKYGYDALQSSGEVGEISNRHLVYYHGLFCEVGRRYQRTLREPDVTALEVELANARAALDTAARNGEANLAAELLIATPLWRRCGLAAEENKRIEALVPAVHGDDALVARLWSRLAKHAGVRGDNVLAFEFAGSAAAAARHCEDADTVVSVLSAYAFSALRVRQIAEAKTALIEAERTLLCVQGGPGLAIATQLFHSEARAFLAMLEGDLSGAAVAFERLLQLSRSVHNLSGELIFTLNLAQIEHARGRTPRAIALIGDIIPKAEAFPRRELLGGALSSLSAFLAAVDEFDDAKQAARAAIDCFLASGQHPAMVALAIEYLALALVFTDERESAARLAGYSDHRLWSYGFEREDTPRIGHERLHAMLREHFEPSALATLLAEGAALSPEEATALATATAED